MTVDALELTPLKMMHIFQIDITFIYKSHPIIIYSGFAHFRHNTSLAVRNTASAVTQTVKWLELCYH